MDTPQTGHRSNWVGLVVIFVILLVLVGVLFPAVQAAIEASRKASCQCHLHMIGLGLQNYASTFRHFPGTGRVVESGGEKHVQGWSFLVQILPYLEYGTLYSTINADGDPDTPEAKPDQEAGRLAVSKTVIREFVCPSAPSEFLGPAGTPPGGARTTYKGMAATHIESLNQCLGLGKPLYGEPKMHPDGMMFPGPGLTSEEIVDGTAHTIMCAETIDDTASLWTRGKDAVLVGLPSYVVQGAVNTGAYSYFHPKWPGWTPRFDGVLAAAQNPPARTYLAYDFRPGGADEGTYPAFDGSQPAWGPSSGHVGIVNHGFCDGSVQALSTRIDPAAYMFMITKNGGDPYHPDPP
jgi:hypothetical protein